MPLARATLGVRSTLSSFIRLFPETVGNGQVRQRGTEGKISPRLITPRRHSRDTTRDRRGAKSFVAVLFFLFSFSFSFHRVSAALGEKNPPRGRRFVTSIYN